MSLFASLRNFDAYTKPLEDFRVRTIAGGTVTLLSSFLIVLLLVTETINFLRIDVVEQLYVDSTSSEQRVDVNFDVTFKKLPCSFVTVDVMDISGDNQDDIRDDVYKLRIDANGKNISGKMAVKLEVNANTTTPGELTTTLTTCGSCYGATEGCCNTCDDVKHAYSLRGWTLDVENVEQCQSDSWVQKLNEYKDEGCRVYGKIQVAKVAGNFHIAPGDPFRTHRSHAHDLHSINPRKFDTSHVINHLSFGNPYPGKLYPLNQKEFNTEKGGIMFQYYLKVVPTLYVHLNRTDPIFSHQFSVTTNQKDVTVAASGLPGFFVHYEFSPLMIKYEERQQSWSSFLVSLCAIIGGLFTVASLIDAFLYTSSRVLMTKME